MRLRQAKASKVTISKPNDASTVSRTRSATLHGSIGGTVVRTLDERESLILSTNYGNGSGARL